jgi:hypothetical protein
MVTNNASNFGTGTSGQVLTSNGSGASPTFQEVAQQPGHPYAVGTALAFGLTAVCIPWVVCGHGGSVPGTAAISNTSIFLIPMYIDEKITYTKIGCQVIGTPGAGSTIDLIIYSNSGTGGLPGAVLITATNLSSAAAGLVEGTISFSPTPGYYWVGVQRNATAAVSLTGYSNADDFAFFTNRALISLGVPTTVIQIQSQLAATNTYGTYNANPTITSNNPVFNIPLIYLR